MKNITLEMLSSPGCHNCAKFLEFWKPIESEWPNVSFKDLDITTPEGQELAQKYMVMSAPGIVLNEELFSTGGVNTDDFLEKLKELSQK